MRSHFRKRCNARCDLADILDMLALSIRQPWAELILRGIKTIEYRSKPTRIIGQKFYIYASKGKGSDWRSAGDAWKVRKADNIVVANAELPPWMTELANALRLFPQELPTGLIVGSAVIEKCLELSTPSHEPFRYEWHLTDVKRSNEYRKPIGRPQPVWFRPF